ncbi:hypothetical protein KBZ07_04055 [Cyanobium sp. BA20m-14]|uniref:hypothetical protein n=1 Tax=Cyanobium sp. BA20m-14 TaxID=2823703 RepID=UPI0020CFB06A|nr:hypothetical protein [Cyanobium sp. BA20m-14]MCP9912587.1 hypothetical protein [Cyanobium sp. BA20m-14]
MTRRTPHTPAVEWMPTGRAVAICGISSSTLQRWVAQGLLEHGREYLNGLTPTSPRRWNLAALEARIEQLRKLPDPLRPELEAQIDAAPPAGGGCGA